MMMTIQPCECTWHHWILPNMVKTVNCMLCLFYHNFLKFKIQMEYISMTQWLGWFSIPPYFNIIAGKLATSETSQCQRISGDLHLAGSRRDTLLNSSSWMPQILPTGLAKGRRRPFLLEPGTPWWVLMENKPTIILFWASISSHQMTSRGSSESSYVARTSSTDWW